MEVRQGDIYWIAPEDEAGVPHPHVVVQAQAGSEALTAGDGQGNRTVLVCGVTSNRKRAGLPGNVLLEAGEANLPRPSVVEAGKLSAVDIARLGEYIGSLSPQRMEQILAGIRFVERLRRDGEGDGIR